jgi:hypothetical protein
MDKPEIGEAEYEVVLLEEDVVAETVVVPKERVRLDTHVVTEDREVVTDLRKEHVRVERDDV